jgi:hypothetical protein
MPAISFNEHGEAYEPAPITSIELQRYRNDTHRALRAYRVRKHPILASLTLWTPLLAFAVSLTIHATLV